MNSFARRLIAVTAASALVSTPALVFGGAAQAGTVRPAGLLDGLGSVVGGTVGSILGGATGSGGSGSGSSGSGSSGTGTAPNPVTVILTTLGGATGSGGSGGSGSTDPLDALGAIASAVTDALTSGDPTALISSLTDLANGVPGGDDLTSTLNSLTSDQLQTLTGMLLGVLPVTDLFAATGGVIPDPIQAILSQTGTPHPTDTASLIAALIGFYQAQGTTDPAPDVKQALPPSALAALLAALQKKTTTPPTTVKTPVKTPVVTKPSTACTHATAKVKRLQKQLKGAKKKHQKARAKALTKKVAKARKAKRSAC